MTRRLTYCILAALILLTQAGMELRAQSRFGSTVEFDRTSHDFGDIHMSQGPVSCSFNVKNIGKSDMVINNVISSCGCTDVKWTREVIAPGASGTISATYKNDEGGYPFDKTLTAYVAGQVVVLHLKGISHEKEINLTEAYPVHYGQLGMRASDIQAGNMLQGQQKSGEVKVANLGKTAIEVSFADVTPGLSVKVTPSTIPAGKTATLTYTVTPDRGQWGRTSFYAVPLVNGRKCKAVDTSGEAKPQKGAEALASEKDPKLGNGKELMAVNVFIKDDFSGLSKEQRAAAANPMFTSSTFNIGNVKAGTRVEATFDCRNIGKAPLHIYKIDTGSSRLTASELLDIKAGGNGRLTATLDTSGLPAGEVLYIVTLTTNSPLRPMVNLYITGFIK